MPEGVKAKHRKKLEARLFKAFLLLSFFLFFVRKKKKGFGRSNSHRVFFALNDFRFANI